MCEGMGGREGSSTVDLALDDEDVADFFFFLSSAAGGADGGGTASAAEEEDEAEGSRESLGSSKARRAIVRSSSLRN